MTGPELAARIAARFPSVTIDEATAHADVMYR
jgi:hypothetical protein